MDQHTGGKWLIHGTERRKNHQLQSLELSCRISIHNIEAVLYYFSSIKFHGTTIADFLPELRISGLYKARRSIKEVPCFCQGHPLNFKVTRDKFFADFDPKTIPDCNSSWNSPMALKWGTKLDAV